ncbi:MULTISPECIES: LCP family protein [unclassified Streptosporangium]|uniref:LCP family protein n=1 Tax=unclassified Streptosporangium TaxID=2632669 RepID=UPI002E2BC1D5|nr:MULTISPECIES: LCP family protein [unclassified Streptosporangium]
MSDHRQAALRDRRSEPTSHGRRGARRAGGDGPPPESPPGDLPTQPGEATPRGKNRKQRKLTVGAWAGIAATGLLVLGTLGGYGVYRNTFSNISGLKIDDKLGNDRPAAIKGALNVLIVGSDTREGDNLKYGQKMANAGKRTDTIILMHIAPDRDKATFVSFPRDSVVNMPACESETGVSVAPRTEMINAAYNEGGITCTITTIEALTDIRINHFVEVDFTGFKSIVDALDGVSVCLTKPVDDKKAKLKLEAGRHVLKGEQALGYVRLRNYGDGSDIGRIERQQRFLSQVVKKATSSELLTDPAKMLNFINTTAKSVRMDDELAKDTGTLFQIGQSAQKLTAGGVKLITVPWIPDPNDKNRVVWNQPYANQLFAAIKNDTEVTLPPDPKAKPAVKREQVRLQVFNGTDTPNRAKDVAAELAEQGFVITHVGNARPATGNVPTTTIRYAKKDTVDGVPYGDAVAARLSGAKRTPVAGKVKPVTVEKYVPAVAPTPTPGVKAPAGPVIQLVIGADWPGVRALSVISNALTDKVVDSKTNPCT